MWCVFKSLANASSFHLTTVFSWGLLSWLLTSLQYRIVRYSRLQKLLLMTFFNYFASVNKPWLSRKIRQDSIILSLRAHSNSLVQSYHCRSDLTFYSSLMSVISCSILLTKEQFSYDSTPSIFADHREIWCYPSGISSSTLCVSVSEWFVTILKIAMTRLQNASVVVESLSISWTLTVFSVIHNHFNLMTCRDWRVIVSDNFLKSSLFCPRFSVIIGWR